MGNPTKLSVTELVGWVTHHDHLTETKNQLAEMKSKRNCLFFSCSNADKKEKPAKTKFSKLVRCVTICTVWFLSLKNNDHSVLSTLFVETGSKHQKSPFTIRAWNATAVDRPRRPTAGPSSWIKLPHNFGQTVLFVSRSALSDCPDVARLLFDDLILCTLKIQQNLCGSSNTGLDFPFDLVYAYGAGLSPRNHCRSPAPEPRSRNRVHHPRCL